MIPEISYTVSVSKFEQLIASAFDLLSPDDITIEEASLRAGFFNKMRLLAVQFKKKAATDSAIAKGDAKAEWSDAMRRVDSKAITEKKEMAQGDEKYRKKCEVQAEFEAEYDRLKDLIDIFTDAHIHYRGLAKEIN